MSTTERPTTCPNGHSMHYWEDTDNGWCEGDECPPVWGLEPGELWPMFVGSVGQEWYRATIRAERAAREAAEGRAERAESALSRIQAISGPTGIATARKIARETLAKMGDPTP